MPGSSWERTPEEREVCLALEKVAAEVGAQNISAGKTFVTLSVTRVPNAP